MKQKISSTAIGSVILYAIVSCVVLSACSLPSITTNNIEYQEGFQHIIKGNTYGYYFDLFLPDAKNSTRNGTILMHRPDEEICVEIENAGQDRAFALQIFVDYEQCNIVVDGQEYGTYFITADANYSNSFSFSIADTIDTRYNHKLLAVLTAGSNVITKEVDYEISNGYAIALDHILVFNENNVVAESKYLQSEVDYVDGGFEGFVLNNDFLSTEHRVPERIISVPAGEQFKLKYQAGGYSECDTVLFMVSMEMEQTEISGQKYIVCSVPNGSVAEGIITLTAPGEVGSYEITGVIVKNPFASTIDEWLPASNSYRFTLDVI